MSASHIPGGNITYECIGPNQYILTLTLFEDCGTNFITNANQNVGVLNDCGYTLSNISLPNTVFQEEVSQLCDSQLPFSECNGGSMPGIYMHVWQDTITLPGPCDSWTFYHTSCCRNASDNLIGTGNNFYFETVLNSQTAPCNTSPAVTTQMIPYVCVNQPTVYNLGVYEPDGNTMTYTLVEALLSNGNPVPYQPPYTGLEPITGMTLNSLTGDLSFTPTVAGNFVVAVLVEEFDDQGNLVGSLLQDFQFEVITCPANTNPVEPAGITNYVGQGSMIAPNEIEMCVGDTFCFELEFTDLNAGDSIFISSNIALALPGATFNQLTWQSPAVAEVCWTASSAVASPTSVVFNARDNACPMFGITFYPIVVNIIESTDAGPDQTICAGDSAVLNVTGGANFVWHALPGGDTLMNGITFGCDTCQNTYAKPAITTTYVVTSDLSGGCTNTDTVTINVVPDFTYSLTQSNTSTCINSEIYIQSVPNPAGSYTYTWSPPTFLDDPTISNPTVTPTAAGNYTYAVEIEAPTGCTKYDTISISVAPHYSPDFSITGLPANIVCGDTVDLETTLNTTTPVCGPSAIPVCQAPMSQYTIGIATDTNTVTTMPAPFGNWYRNNKQQYLFLASELQAAGLVPGKIVQVSFEVTTLNGATTYDNFTINMGCTSSSALTGWEAGLTEVFSPQNVVVATGWNILTFTTAYEWDGVSNIVIETCYNNLSVPFTQNSQSPMMATTFNSSSYYQSDAVAACPTTIAPIIQALRPIIRFSNCSMVPDPANYTFEWTPPLDVDDPTAQNTFATPQSDVTYQMVVTDINGGCTDTATVAIVVECCDSPIPTVTNVSCFNANDGQVEVQPVSGAPGPYTVELVDPLTMTVLQTDPGVMTTTTFTGLGPGNYLITALDGTGCMADTLITITEPPLLSISVSNDTAICIGDSVELSAFGGTGYSWSPTTNLSDPTSANTWYTGTTTQEFFVTVTDASGCSNIDSVTVTVNTLPVITISNDTTICINDTISLTAGGGDTYSWNPTATLGTPSQATTTAFPVTTTTYEAIVTDLNGCVDSAEVDVTVQTLPAVDAGLDVDICFGDTIQLTTTGATGYTWAPADSISNINIADPLVWPSDTTEYIVTGADGLNCINTDTVVVNVNPLPTPDAGPDLWVCPGDQVQINATGGGTYSWSPATGLSDPNIDNPMAGPADTTIYILSVTDGNGCIDTDTMTVFVNATVPTDAGTDTTICEGDTIQIGGAPTSVNGTTYFWTPAGLVDDPNVANPMAFPTVDTWFYVATTNDTCSGLDSVLVTVNPYPLANAGADIQICIGDTAQLGATGGVSYVWTPDLDLSDDSIAGPQAWPMDTTAYVVAVTDANGCTQTDTMEVIVNPLPTVSAGADDAICLGDTAQLSASGGDLYTWTPTDSLSDANIFDPMAWPTATTDYMVTVTDSNGCINSDTMTLTVNSLPVVDAGSTVNFCIGDSVQLGASGADTYVWNPTTDLSDPNIADPWVSSVFTQNYIVEGTDGNGCQNTDTVLVIVNSLPLVNAGADVQICIGDSTQLLVTGADDYSWSPITGLSDATIDDPWASPTDTTEYVVIGTDGNGCVNTDTMMVIVNPLPNAVAGPDVDICLGDSTQLSATGGVSYAWIPSMYVTDSTLADPMAFPDTTMNFTVMVTDSNTCINYDTTTVNVFRVSTIPDTTICNYDSVQLAVYGSPGNTFSWTPTTGLTNPAIDNPVATPNNTTTYTVTVTDIAGCVDQASVEITVNDVPDPEYTFTVEPGCDGIVVDITDNSSLTDSYQWLFSNGESSQEVNPTVIFEYGNDYTIQLIASNNYGCESIMDTTALAGDFESYYDILIPNVFTPNGDGDNDQFWVQVPGHLPDCLELTVYNRWGQVMFKSAGSVIVWDGKTTNGEDAPEGTYMFTIEIKELRYNGTMMLFR